ncbi:DMT family transporter [Vibrio sp. SCSIO 43136]|uniref:DMT family transporter n=1 Tax=Vibrio sp. SCSIO 43136 TaxID=2819101 RepID=UPI00207609C2|nr:DMT family transporter [Vibrio sp. SCSIO 43136]USD68087.1 DMT family transporter [Vibrio sp. SCSIO 43136]
MSNNFIATMLMLASTLSLSLTGVFAKFLSEEMSTQLHAFIRFILPALVLILPMVLNRISLPQAGMWRTLMIRAACLASCQVCFIHAIGELTLVESIVLFSTGPLFMPVLEKVIFGNQVKAVTLGCLFLTFVGVLFLAGDVRTVELKPELLLGLLAGVFNAGSQVSLFRASQYQLSSVAINFWCFLIAAVLMSPMLMILELPSGDSLLLDFPFEHSFIWIMAFTMTLMIINTQLCRSKAYRLVSSGSALAPLIYTNLVFSLIWQWLLFDETLTPQKYLGLAIIVSATLINTFWGKLSFRFQLNVNNNSPVEKRQ